MKPYDGVRAELVKGIKNKMWESNRNTRAFVEPLKISRSAVMSILNEDSRAPRLSTIWDIAEHYGYDAIGEDFVPDDGAMLTYSVAHERMCANIRRIMDQRLMPIRRLARMSGVSAETLRYILSNDVSPNLVTLWNIANALDCKRIGELFNYPYDK